LQTIEIAQSGRYDPVEDSIEDGSVTFRVMMVFFYFFTVILLLNVLIGKWSSCIRFTEKALHCTTANFSLSRLITALVNDAFSESVNESGSSNWKLVADVIAGKPPVI
jgi:hypothetical protein